MSNFLLGCDVFGLIPVLDSLEIRDRDGFIIYKNNKVNRTVFFSKPKNYPLKISKGYIGEFSNLKRYRNYEIKKLPKPSRKKFPKNKIPDISKINIKKLVEFDDSVKIARIKLDINNNWSIKWIKINRDFWDNQTQIEKELIIGHEIGHVYYTREDYCDLFAVYQMIKRGWDYKFFMDKEFNILNGLRKFNIKDHVEF